jgi:hypothetical protein
MASLGFTFDPAGVPDGPGPFNGLPDHPAIQELAGWRQWVAWRFEDRDGKPTKIPVNPRTGGNAISTNSGTWGTLQEAERRAIRGELPGVGFVLTAADDFTGVDIDKAVDEKGDLAPWAAEIVALGETYTEVSPSGRGIRMIVRGKIPSTVKSDAAGVEIYRDKRYLTITGDHVPNTPVDIRAAPRTLAALMARIEAAKLDLWSASTPPSTTPKPAENRPAKTSFDTTPGNGSDFFRRVNDVALERLEAWVPRIFPAARFHPGTGAYRVTSRALGRDLQEDLSLAPNGIVDFGVHDMGDPNQGKRSAIDIALQYGPPSTVQDAALWLCDQMGKDPRSLGWEDREALAEAGAEIARRLTRTRDGELMDEDTGELVEEPKPKGNAFPDHLAHPPGLLGELVDWICATARRPSRVLALGAALTLVGTAMGRHTSGPTHSGTHLYVLALAPTGAGKDHALQQIKRVLAAARMGPSIGPDEFISMPAVVNFMLRAPLSLCPMDEFGGFLRRINSRKASGFEQTITKTLRTAWGTNFGMMRTPEWAGRPAESIFAPALSIYGASTPEEFFAALEGGDVVNGLLNRFLLLSTEERPPDREPELPANIVPDRIVELLSGLFGGGNPILAATQCMVSSSEVMPEVVPWGADGAKAVFETMAAQIERMGDDKPEMKPFFARSAEMAVRMATIVAVGRGAAKPVLGYEDMCWGRDVAMWSARTMMDSAGLYMAETDVQADANRILRMIREAGGRISKRDLLRRLQHRMKARDFDEVMKSLAESGAVQVAKETPEKGGTPTIWYQCGP